VAALTVSGPGEGMGIASDGRRKSRGCIRRTSCLRSTHPGNCMHLRRCDCFRHAALQTGRGGAARPGVA